MKRWMKQFLSVALCAVMTITAVYTNTDTANAQEEAKWKAGVYGVTAQFLKGTASDSAASSANGVIKDQKAGIMVSQDGSAKAMINLQETQGMNFYNFKYTADGTNYSAVQVLSGEEEAPAQIAVPLPDYSGVVVMKATYPNPVMGPHEVDIYLHVDVAEIPFEETEEENDENGSDENNSNDNNENEGSENSGNENNEGKEDNNTEESDGLKEGTYTVKAEFKKQDGSNSSAYETIVNQEAEVVVDAEGKATVFLNLQPADGMTFYNFKYADGTNYKTTAVEEGTTEAPTKISFVLPDMSGVVAMKGTYPNPVMGPHEVDLFLHLDLSVIPGAETGAGNGDGSGNGSDSGDGSGTGGSGNQNNGDDDGGSNEETELDKDNLADGIYEVSVALWNASSDQASMGAPGLLGATSDDPWSTARIVVEDGIYTMYLYTQEMVMGTVQARLQYMQVTDADGDFKEASAVGTAGSDPTAFYFGMPHTEEYISVKINPMVAMMNNQYIDARLKTNWTTLVTAAEGTDPATAPQDENPTAGASGTVGTGAAGTGTTGAAKTGDNANVFGYLSAILLSLVAIYYMRQKGLIGRIEE